MNLKFQLLLKNLMSLKNRLNHLFLMFDLILKFQRLQMNQLYLLNLMNLSYHLNLKYDLLHLYHQLLSYLEYLRNHLNLKF
jgi:hypothetical protein